MTDEKTLTCDVAILGSGPTGLTAANYLGLQGIDCILVERNATTVQAPRAVSIDDESLRTMQSLGLVDAVMADIAPDYGSHYLTTEGVCFARVEPTTREYGYPRRSAFTQPELEAAMRKGLERFENVRTLYSHTCEKILEDDEGVTLELAAPGGEKVSLRAKYLAGCDGGRSMVRKFIGAELQGSTYEEKWLIVDMAETKERFRQTRVLCNPDRPAICLPGPDGKRRYEFMLHKGEIEAEMEKPEKVSELLAMYGPDADAPVVRRQVYTFHARICDRWNTKRVFIAGDAAHLTPPFAGQGMNSGVRDAHALAWRLAGVIKGQLGQGVFNSYRKERAPHAWALIEMAINLGKVMMPSNRIQARLVQTAFRVMSLIPTVQAYFAQMKYKPKPFYKEGFLLPDAGSKLIGRMFPQPDVERLDRSRAKMDDLIGNRFALIAYGENAQERIATGRGYDFGLKDCCELAISPMRLNIDRSADPAVTAVRDLTDLLGATLPASRDTMVLIRPDRYVMAAADVTNPADIATLARNVRELVNRTKG